MSTRTQRYRVRRLTTIGLVAWLAAAGVAAGETIYRFQGQAVTSSADPIGLGVDLDTGFGLYLGVEYLFHERYGVEVGASWAELEQSAVLNLFLASVDTRAELAVKPVTVAFNFHLTPQSRYDFYVAPKIGWAFFDDLEIRTEIDLGGFGGFNFPGVLLGGFNLTVLPPGVAPTTTRLAIEDQFLFGLRLGFDVPFGDSSWSFASSVDYTDLDLELEIAQGASVGLDPLQVGVGVAYTF